MREMERWHGYRLFILPWKAVYGVHDWNDEVDRIERSNVCHEIPYARFNRWLPFVVNCQVNNEKRIS